MCVPAGILQGCVVPAVYWRNCNSLGQQISHSRGLPFGGRQVQGCTPVIVGAVQIIAQGYQALEPVDIACTGRVDCAIAGVEFGNLARAPRLNLEVFTSVS